MSRHSPSQDDQQNLSKGLLEDKIVTETLHAKQIQLDRLHETIEATKQKEKKRIANFRDKLEDLRQQEVQLKNSTKQAKDAFLEADKRYNLALGRNQKIVNDTAERNLYLQEQERLIAQTVDKGNEKVQELDYAYAELERKIKDRTQSLINLDAELADKAAGISDLQERLQALEQRYNQVVVSMRQELADARERLEEVKAVTEEQQAIVDTKLSTLKLKEESLMAKIAALRKERADFALEKRRFSATQNLYADV